MRRAGMEGSRAAQGCGLRIDPLGRFIGSSSPSSAWRKISRSSPVMPSPAQLIGARGRRRLAVRMAAGKRL
jgi:hypothetical protein